MDKGLVALSTTTVIVYMGVTLFIPVPFFIKIQNVVYIGLYILTTYLALYRTSFTPLIILITFNIGRLSRSIITSTGEVGYMAAQHTPLMILLIIFLGYTIYRFHEMNR